MRKRQREDAIATAIASKWQNNPRQMVAIEVNCIEWDGNVCHLFLHTYTLQLFSMLSKQAPQHPTIESLPLSLCVQFNGVE